MQSFKILPRRRARQLLIAALVACLAAGSASARGWHHGWRLVISGTPSTSDVVGQVYSFTPSVSGSRWHTLNFSISGKPSWATFDSANGEISGTPTSSNVGTFSNIVISVSDGPDTASLAPFDITVTSPPNAAPTISGQPPTTATVGVAYSFTPSASDSDGDTLSFSVQNLPSWATFSTLTGTISGTPASGSVGTDSNIVISVSDGVTSVSLSPFSITVSNPANAAPTISGQPPTTATVGVAYSFTPSASDSDGDTLSFSVQNLPPWAAFSTTKGTISGTPTSGSVGTDSNIVISVSDGVTAASLPAFSITVNNPPNTAPTISGQPPTAATVGIAYSFTPSASDGDGDTLFFSVQNLPAWATFSISKGTISGTPTSGNVGTYSNIVISVSDGVTSVSLSPFSITVSNPPTPGSATLTWTAPTTNTDGSALTDLAGYHVYYGTSPSSMTQVIDIASAGTTTYTIGGLSSGTWYFGINAYTTSGVESALSTVVSKAIP